MFDLFFTEESKKFLKKLNKMRIQTDIEEQIIDRFKEHKEELKVFITVRGEVE